MSQEDELGTLIAVVLKAKDLNDKHSFYKQDVFAQVTFNGITKKTKVDIKGGQHPVWDEEMRFTVMKDSAPKFRELEVSCYAKESRADDLLGKGKVDITETLKTGEFDDWVKLDIDGVARGEMYLEMTYYAKGPAPPKPLAVVKNTTALNRRPSKLSSAERLWRPPQQQTPPTSNNGAPYRGEMYGQGHTPPSSNHLLLPSTSPPSSRSSSASGRESPLPPVPDDIPNTLKPGAGARPKPQSQPPAQNLMPAQGLQAVPSILKPGKGSTRPAANHARHPSGSPPRADARLPTQSFGYTQAASQPQYNYPSTSPPVHSPPTQEYPGAASYPPPPSRDSWAPNNEPSGSFSFPVPNVAPPTQGSYDYKPDNYYGPDHPHNRRQAHYSPPGNGASNLPDPYLQARYQSPLPLPPGSESAASRGRQPAVPPKENPQEAARIQALRLAEEEAKRRKEQEEKDLELARQLDSMELPPGTASPPARGRQPVLPPKKKENPQETARLKALQLKEEEARRRKEQEEKDLELARQLDMELNLDDPPAGGNRRPSNAPMPGGW